MLNSTLLMALGAPEIAIILVIVLLLFGGKKIPELMRGLGKGVREFKDGKDGTDSDLYDRDGNKVNKPL
jgi:sec-independent protein translocase protein TatA